MAMRLPDGTQPTTASDNMSVFSPHFLQVFNAHRTTDPSMLDNVPQQRTMWELNDSISWEEFTKAVRKLKNAKAHVTPVFHRKHSRQCRLLIYDTSTSMLMTSSSVIWITSNGTIACVSQFQKAVTSPIPINGEE